MPAVRMLARLAGGALLVLAAPAPSAGQGPRYDKVGQVAFTLQEWVRQSGEPPVILLRAETVEKGYPCSDLRIGHQLQVEGHALTLRLTRIERGDMCNNSSGPAGLSEVLTLPAGAYTLLVRNGRKRDLLALQITDSSLTMRGRGSPRVAEVDQTWWRRPLGSFAVTCNVRNAPDLCRRFGEWLLRVPGVVPLTFPDGGTDPYRRSDDRPSDSKVDAYRATSAEAFSTIASCIQEIAPQIRSAVGVAIRVQTWTDEIRYANSNGTYSRRSPPPPVGFRCRRLPGAPEVIAPPDSIPGWVRADSSIGADGFTRGVILALFHEGTSRVAREAFFESARATLIGGVPSPVDLEGYYLLQLDVPAAAADPDSVVAVLRRSPLVDTVSREYRLDPAPGGWSTDPRLRDTAAAAWLRPPLPRAMNLPRDTGLSVVAPPPSGHRYRRDVLAVRFADSVRTPQLLSILALMHGRIIGGRSLGIQEDFYIIQVPDPGPSWERVSAVKDRLLAMPGVLDVYLLHPQGSEGRLRSSLLTPGARH